MPSLWNKKCILVISCVLLCNGQVYSKTGKIQAVDKIINKVFNLTSQSLKNANPDEKSLIMKKVEEHLKKSAESLGSKADKYVKIIMQGLQIMANNQIKSQNYIATVDASQHHVGQGALRTGDSEFISKKDADTQDLAHKMMDLAETYFHKYENPGNNKPKLMEDIKQKVLETAKQRHDSIHAKHQEIKKYTDLITRGLELMIKNITTQDPSERRMIMEFINRNLQITRNKDKDYRKENDNQEDKDNYLLYTSITEHDNKLEEDSYTAELVSSREGLTNSYTCDDVFQKTCEDIEILNKFVCLDNKVTLPLSNLCNGVINCPDGSDEGHCVEQAMDRLARAASLMTLIEKYFFRNCYLSDNSSNEINHNNVLHDVLQRQTGFINKYMNDSLEFKNPNAFKQTLNEVFTVVNTLASALESSLCDFESDKTENNVLDGRKFIPVKKDSIEVIEREPRDVNKIKLKICSCSGSSCAKPDCAGACKRICLYKYNLARWSCNAVDASTSVPLDMVCDGKLDCYDQTDENGCEVGTSLKKFEANEIFDNVIQSINIKIMKKEYSSVKKKLRALVQSILNLQKEIMNSKYDILNVKQVRDVCFASLVSIYEDIVAESSSIQHLEDVHLFLTNMNEKLMKALKLSHTGNDNIISPGGCFCRQSECAAVSCSPSCKRACAVRPKLTKYWCKGTAGNNNTSINIDAICDRTPNCPFEDDESHCSDEICRKHHLLLVRHSIRDVGEKLKGTSVGEALRSWRTKVLSTVKVAEFKERPTVKSLRELVGGSLGDLVSVYAALDDTRRANNANVLKEFVDVAQRMMENLRSCAN